MSSNVRAIVLHEFGAPLTVAKCETVALPELGPQMARVRVLAAPINPADLNVLEGKYPLRPELPGVPGVEGVGVIEEIGAEVATVRVGDRVLLPHGVGSWREMAMVDVGQGLMVVPPEVPVLQAAMLKINPATALCMLSDFVRLERGDWIVQNAANSAVGRAVIQFAREKGLRTVNFVRRPELIGELQALGADVVLLDDGDPREEIAAATDRAPLRLALNAVGGDSALRLAKSLTRGGTLVTYGAMGRQPLKIPNALLIFQNLICTGFWISQWYRDAKPEQQRALFAELCDLAGRGILYSPVERTYALEEVTAALTHAAQSGRSGKILFADKSILT